MDVDFADDIALLSEGKTSTQQPLNSYIRQNWQQPT
jgi:hypothetical protein